MAITSLDGLLAAAHQYPAYMKGSSRTSVAGIPFSTFDMGGNPQGTLNVGNTANGIVPTNALNGYPKMTAFAGGTIGYLAGVTFGGSVAARHAVFDCLFSCGAYAFNAATTLASAPSYAARVPSANYNGLSIWLEAVTAFTGNLSCAITYTNQAGVTGRTTGTVSTGAALIVGRMFQMPLQAGDTGVQSIQSITATVATAGTFNVHVMRKLTECRVRINNDGDTLDFTKTGFPQVYADSALRVVSYTDGTTTGIFELTYDIAAG